MTESASAQRAKMATRQAGKACREGRRSECGPRAAGSRNKSPRGDVAEPKRRTKQGRINESERSLQGHEPEARAGRSPKRVPVQRPKEGGGRPQKEGPREGRRSE